LAGDPLPVGCKKLAGSEHTFRIRVGDYRMGRRRRIQEHRSDKESWRDPAGCVLEIPFDSALKVDNFEEMNRLTIEIEPEQHRQIKTLATFSGMTIKEFILSKTIGPQRAAAGDATDRLMGSVKNAARLREAIVIPGSEHRVFESVEDLKDALGI
jgi:hypothetical protein